MSNFDTRHGRYFSRGRDFEQSLSPVRRRYRSRSRERSLSRDRIAKIERGRSRDKFERRRSRERFSKSRPGDNKLRSRSRDRYHTTYSREQATFDARGSMERYDYQFNTVNVDLVRSETDYGRNMQYDSSPDRRRIEEFRDGGQPNYQQRNENYWGNREEEPRPDIENKESQYLHFSTPLAPIVSQDAAPAPESNISLGNVSSQQTPTFGPEKLASTVSEFDPTNPEITAQMWIKQIDHFGDQKGWSSEERKLHFTSKLSGSAKDWFISGNRISEPWNKIKKQFVQAFPSEMDFHKSLLTMVERVKQLDESLSSYLTHKTVLMDKCGISGRKAVSCIIGGLNDSVNELKQEAYDMNFETSEELYNFLKDKIVDGSVKDKKNQKISKICYNCKSPGHKQADCPKEKPRKKNPKYFKNVYVNGTSLKAYFDVKTSKITLRIKDANAAKIHFRRKPISINVGGNSKIIAVAKEQVIIKVDSVFCTVNVFIVPNHIQTTAVVLGTDLLKYTNLIETENGISFTSLKTVSRKQNTNSQEHIPSIQSQFKDTSRNHSYKEEPHVWLDNSRFKYQDHPAPNRSPRRMSPVRSPMNTPPAPPRLFEKSHPFLSKTFYGNPYS